MTIPYGIARLNDFGALLSGLIGRGEEAGGDRVLRHLARAHAHETWHWAREHPECLAGPASLFSTSNEDKKRDMGGQGP